jgi:hypothetical protein
MYTLTIVIGIPLILFGWYAINIKQFLRDQLNASHDEQEPSDIQSIQSQLAMLDHLDSYLAWHLDHHTTTAGGALKNEIQVLRQIIKSKEPTQAAVDSLNQEWLRKIGGSEHSKDAM